MSPASSQTLPDELWMLIFEHHHCKLYQRRALELSMCCRRFRKMLLPAIFGDFEVIVDYQGRQGICPWRTHTFRDFYTFLMTNRHIIPLVHTLRLYVQFEMGDTWQKQQQHWDPDLFLTITTALPRLAHLHLQSVLLGEAADVARAARAHSPLQLESLHISLPRALGDGSIPAPFFTGLLRAVAHTDLLDLVDLHALDGKPKFAEHPTCTALAMAEETFCAPLLRDLVRRPSLHNLTSLEVQDDWHHCDFHALAPVLEIVGPNLEHLGLGMNSLPGELRRAVHDWHLFVFSHCKKLQSLAFFLWIYPQHYLYKDSFDYRSFVLAENAWRPAKRVLEYMLLSAELPISEDHTMDVGLDDAGNEDTMLSDDGGSEWSDDSIQSGGYDHYDGPYEFKPGTLHTIALKLITHCDIFACPCKLDEIKRDWGMQAQFFGWVDDALARCVQIPGIETIELGLTPTSNAAWMIRDWRHIAQKVLPEFFPKTASTGRLRFNEFARWPCRGSPSIDETTWQDGDDTI